MSQEQYYYSPDNGTSWVGPFNMQQLNELRTSGIVQPSFPIYSDAGGGVTTAPQHQSAMAPSVPPQGYNQSAVYPQSQGYPQGIPQIQGYVQPSVNPVHNPVVTESVLSLIKGLFIVKFGGRMQRQKFWMSQLFFCLLWVACYVVEVVLGILIGCLIFAGGGGISDEGVGVVVFIFEMPFLILYMYCCLVGLGMAVRRLHDIGRSGWMVLLGVIPVIGAIWLLVMYCTDSQRGTNQWGANPKGC